MKKFLLGCLVGSSFVSTAAFAGECDYGRGQRGFDAGFKQQSGFIQTLWDAFGDCGDADPFLKEIDVEFNTNTTSVMLQCRNAGINEALAEKFIEINARCSDECHSSGRKQGEMNAKIFCGVASQQQNTGYSARAVNLQMCDQQVAQACRVAFTGYVQRNCDDFRLAELDRFEQMLNAACPN